MKTKVKKLLTVFLVMCSAAAFAQTGSISGVVLDDSNFPMPGATVFITSLNKGSVSDVNGKFEIVNVPYGDYDLVIKFLGYKDKNISVSISNEKGEKVKVALEAGAITGDEIVVYGDRLKGQAKALNNQKNRTNITNMVASDQIGRFPDANIGDAMKRIPGITMQNDQGEARDIIIRGMAPQLNSVNINGSRVPSAEGDNRRVQMDLIPSDMIQMIEVNKVVTPALDADAIGGSVNLVTRTVAADQRLSGTVASGYNFLSEQPIWTGALIYSDRFMNDKLGMIISGSYNNHNFGSDNIEAEWVNTDDNGVIADEFQLRTYDVQRVRRSASLGMDYQFDNKNMIAFNMISNWRDDWENRYRFVAADLADAVSEGTEMSAGIWDIEGTIERQSKGGIDNDRIKNKRLEDQRTSNYTLRGEHLIKNKLKVWWSTNYAKASEERQNERYVQYAGEAIPMILDISDTKKPLAYSTSSNEYAALELDELTEENQFTQEENRNAKIDLQLPLNSQGILKFGSVYRHKTKERTNSYIEYEPTDDNTQFGNLTMTGIDLVDQSNSDFLPGEEYSAGYFITKEFLGGLNLTDELLFEGEDKPDEYAPSNYKATENIIGAYAMIDYQITDKLSGITGVRMENTNVDYNGFEYAALYDAVTDETIESVTQTTGSNSYTNILPNLQFKYDLKENTSLRLAYSNTIARPGYYQLVPFEAFVQEDDEVSRGNPNLKPTVSNNLDFMAEQYLKDIGLISLGFFYKDVTDFIYEQTQSEVVDPSYDDPIDLTLFKNGRGAQVIGLESAVQKQFGGLGLYVNYTFTHSTTDGIQDRVDEDLALPGTAKHMFNASISYETDKLVARISLNHASDYLEEVGGEAFEDIFYDKQTFLDFNASYAFKSNWRVFCELNNITNQPLRFYQGSEGYTFQEEYYNMRLNFGVKFDLQGK